MFITKRKIFIFNFANIYFADEPFSIAIPDCDVLTYHTYKNWGDIKKYEKKICFTTAIDLNQDIDVIWNRIKRQHKRHIRRAEENGIDVTISNNYEKFHQLYTKLLNQKNCTGPAELNIPSLEFMQKYGILFIAENQGEIIGGNLYFHDMHNAIMMSNAYPIFEDTIENKKRSTDANCYLHWNAMEYFKNMGIINYDFGGVLCNDININHQLSGGDYFMRSFGGTVIPQYKYIKFNNFFTKSLFYSWNFSLTGNVHGFSHR